MKKYILISTQLFTALMRAQTSNYKKDKTGFFLQDSESTMRIVDLSDPQPTVYYILSWRGEKPSSVPSQYREDGNNPKSNKIFTSQELIDYLAENERVINLAV